MALYGCFMPYNRNRLLGGKRTEKRRNNVCLLRRVFYDVFVASASAQKPEGRLVHSVFFQGFGIRFPNIAVKV